MEWEIAAVTVQQGPDGLVDSASISRPHVEGEMVVEEDARVSGKLNGHDHRYVVTNGWLAENDKRFPALRINAEALEARFSTRAWLSPFRKIGGPLVILAVMALILWAVLRSKGKVRTPENRN
jgi:hypothetical protein